MSEIIKLIRHVDKNNVKKELSRMLSAAMEESEELKSSLGRQFNSYKNLGGNIFLSEAKNKIRDIQLLIDDIEAIEEGVRNLKTHNREESND